MSETLSSAVAPFEFTGGRLCLDFVNTVDGRIKQNSKELLTQYSDLVLWGRQAALLSFEQALHLLKRADEQPEEAQLALQRAIEVREAIYRIFLAHTQGIAPAQTDLGTFNRTLAQAMAHLCLVSIEEKFVWDWSLDDGEVDQILWAVVRSAADVMASDELQDVRICAANDCGWLFFDTSKNHSRRWCDMTSCGNRAKVRRHHARKKSDSST